MFRDGFMVNVNALRMTVTKSSLYSDP